jgi:hypothetical protein
MFDKSRYLSLWVVVASGSFVVGVSGFVKSAARALYCPLSLLSVWGTLQLVAENRQLKSDLLAFEARTLELEAKLADQVTTPAWRGQCSEETQPRQGSEENKKRL